jgi:hypothetical protein
LAVRKMPPGDPPGLGGVLSGEPTVPKRNPLLEVIAIVLS